jgi:hypothetical protein
MRTILKAVFAVFVGFSVTVAFAFAATATSTATSTVPATTTGTTCLNLTFSLYKGQFAKGAAAEIIALQKFLIVQGYKTVKVTAVFDDATEAAVTSFQIKNHVPGPGLGGVGPKTRAIIKSVSCGSLSSLTSSAATFYRNLGIGSTGSDVKALQVFLNQNPLTQVSKSGPGSPGNETSYYGPATAAAVKKFQTSVSNDPMAATKLSSTGIVDTPTRTYLQKLLASKSKNNTGGSGQLVGTASSSLSNVVTINGNGNGNNGNGNGNGGGNGSNGGGNGGGGGGGGTPVPVTYTITATAGTNGSISPGGTISANAGTSQTVTFSPSTGYQIQTVSVDGSLIGSPNSYTFTNITANHTIAVTFVLIPIQPTTYTITASAGTGGSISPVGLTTVNSGASQGYTITPLTGYQIQAITVDGSSVGSPGTYTFSNVTGNHTISASFTQIPLVTFNIGASAGSGGTISPSGTNTVTQGGSATYTIIPNSGFQVASVIVDGVDKGAITSFTFTNVIANHTISASFSAVTVTFNITASSGTGGSISPSGTVSVNQNTNKTFTITPTTGNQIASVTVDGVSQGVISSYTFSNVTGNHTISASFSVITYTITASAGSGGTISPNGTLSLNSGASQTYTVTPGTGMQINTVTIDGAAATPAGTYIFSNISANHTISVTFAPVPTFTITASTGANGSISPNGVTTLTSGGSQIYTITPASGFQIASVLVDGVSQGAVGTFTFSAISANHTISATFSVVNTPTFTINSSAGTNGSISPNGVTTLNSGASQIYTITPASGFQVASVTVDGTSVGAVATYTFSNVIANHTISATFTQVVGGGSGTTYEVGPGKTYARINDAPLNTLKPGDTVKVYAKSTPYNEKLCLSASGTPTSPINFIGVPDASGNPPIIDANNAITKSTDNCAAYGAVYSQPAGAILFSANIIAWNAQVHDIYFSTFQVQGAHTGNFYTDGTGARTAYGSGAACFAIWSTVNLTLDHVVATGCDDGLLALSNNANSKNVQVLNSVFKLNGVNGSYLYHNLYTEVDGMTIKGSKFLGLIPGAQGSNLKDRSAATDIEDNILTQGYAASFFDPSTVNSVASRELDLVESDPTRLSTQSNYGGAFVKDNTFIEYGGPCYSIHYGGDGGDSVNVSDWRNKTFQFYNNTVVLQADTADCWRAPFFSESTNAKN